MKKKVIRKNDELQEKKNSLMKINIRRFNRKVRK